MDRYRTHIRGARRAADIGAEVRPSGWCHGIRDHGGSITQVVLDPAGWPFKTAETPRNAR